MVDRCPIGGFAAYASRHTECHQIATQRSAAGTYQSLTGPATCADALTHWHCFGLGGWDLSRVLSTPNRRHFPGEEYWAPLQDHRARRRERAGVAGWRVAAGRSTPSDGPGPGPVRRCGAVAGAAGAVLRARSELAGPVASDPVISRLVSTLAADASEALRAIRTARAAARKRAWALAGEAGPGADGSLITVDTDATIVLAHSEKEKAAPSGRRRSGSIRWPRSPTTAPERAGSRWPSCCAPATPVRTPRPSTIEVTRLALAQLPRPPRLSFCVMN